MAWSGLKGTNIFESMHPLGSTSRQRVDNRIFAEAFNQTSGTEVPVGNNCN